MKWTNQQVNAVLQKQATAKTKYNAKRVLLDGIWFDSKQEVKRYETLKLMLAAKLITNLKIHPVFPIVYRETRICDVELDFAYDKQGQRIYEDSKGHDTDMSRLKRKLVEAFFDITVEVIK